MNLILINFSKDESLLFIGNLKFDDFLKAWGDVGIKIKEFYGYNREKYFYLESVEECYTLEDLKNFIRLNKVDTINNIEFESQSCNIEVNDLHDYTIRQHSAQNSLLLNVLSSTTGFDLKLIDHPEQLMNKYLLVRGQHIIKEFSSFDEYLNSELDEEE